MGSPPHSCKTQGDVHIDLWQSFDSQISQHSDREREKLHREVQLDKDIIKVKTALEDLRRVLDSHSKRLRNETTTDFEKLRELTKAKLAEGKKVRGTPT